MRELLEVFIRPEGGPITDVWWLFILELWYCYRIWREYCNIYWQGKSGPDFILTCITSLIPQSTIFPLVYMAVGKAAIQFTHWHKYWWYIKGFFLFECISYATLVGDFKFFGRKNMLIESNLFMDNASEDTLFLYIFLIYFAINKEITFCLHTRY